MSWNAWNTWSAVVAVALAGCVPQSVVFDRGRDVAGDADAADGLGVVDQGVDATPDGDAFDAADARRCSTFAECEDRNPCTADSCVAGQCSYAAIAGPCDDGVYCNGVDTCASGTCVHAGNPCPMFGATDTCDETNRWCRCNDGDVCTGNDHMTATGCRGDARAAHHTLCGPCDSSGCRMCCDGTCRDVHSNAYCAGCDSPCSGSETCRYDMGRPCAWLWCCGG